MALFSFSILFETLSWCIKLSQTTQLNSFPLNHSQTTQLNPFPLNQAFSLYELMYILLYEFENINSNTKWQDQLKYIHSNFYKSYSQCIVAIQP